MVITIINHSIVFILILLFLLCTLEPVKRLQLNPKFRFLKVITKYHSIYAWLLLRYMAFLQKKLLHPSVEKWYG